MKIFTIKHIGPSNTFSKKFSITFFGSVNEQIQQLKAKVEVTFSNFQRVMGPTFFIILNGIGTSISLNKFRNLFIISLWNGL